jgi:hypothetical protein
MISADNVSGDNQKIFEYSIAKALDGFVKFYLSGNQEILGDTKSLLKSLKEIAELEEDAGMWWIIRLLLLISEGFNQASVWNVLPAFFSIEDEQVKGYIHSLVYMRPRGNYELFMSQRGSLPTVLSENTGSVVSIPTSSGKTRIAEIAILHSLKKKPSGKILYIAPFRSLAFEGRETACKKFLNILESLFRIFMAVACTANSMK